MSKSSARPGIRLRGVRHNNLKNFDLDLPLNQLIVVTGLSGSGKSSLAFDTLFAEGQRRYIETFSPYARQFLDRMDKPQVDRIEGIPPAIAVEQRNTVKTTRSTVGTMTEICDYMKALWPHVAQLHCRQCGQPVRKDTPQDVWREASAGAADRSVERLVTFELPLSDKLTLAESLALVARQGYQRLLVGGRVIRLEEAAARVAGEAGSLVVVQDRLRPAGNRARFIEACEQAYHFGKGRLTLWTLDENSHARDSRHFSNRLHCARCDLEYRPPTPALFSFNHPVGACPTCRGFGRIISIDYHLAMPDRSRTLAEGVVKPWQTGQGLECQADLLRLCRQHQIPTDVPFQDLPPEWQKFVIEGDPNYGKDAAHEWPHAWYGVKGYFRWLESRAYKMHVRVLLSRYRAYTACPDCQGKRFQPDTLLYRAPRPPALWESPGTKSEGPSGLTLADFYHLPIRDALRFVADLETRLGLRRNDPQAILLGEVKSRLAYLEAVGLGYLTLDRPTRSLSGGETERVNLTTCLGTRLVNTLFVLDEPSVGLHPRDTQRLVHTLQQLRDAGNTVVVVEHEASVIRAANQIVDLGPGHGASGGQVVFQGSYRGILKAPASLTGAYLSGRKHIELPPRRPVLLSPATGSIPRNTIPEALKLRDVSAPAPAPQPCEFLRLEHATRHNLKDLTVDIPLGRLVCITGVSGSGKTTLVREVLLPLLAARLETQRPPGKASERSDAEAVESDDDQELSTEAEAPAARISGWESLGRVVLVDQAILGKTPRSNPAVYIGAFEEIREFFAQTEPARQRGLNASAFSFNSTQGQCERCRGAGYEKIEMQFLSDVFIRCPDCNGRRYRQHILEVKVKGAWSRPWSIADLLEATVEESRQFLSAFTESRPARRAVESLRWLEEVGLGYLKLGQPINTLSGGESQRLKLVRHLAEAERDADGKLDTTGADKPTLFLFDEPTTGLHFDDVRVLLGVLQRLVSSGHSVLVIEHNLEVIKCADWVIDLGPDAGDEGGQVVAVGTPETVAACAHSHTGQALREVLPAKKTSRSANPNRTVPRRMR